MFLSFYVLLFYTVLHRSGSSMVVGVDADGGTNLFQNNEFIYLINDDKFGLKIKLHVAGKQR